MRSVTWWLSEGAHVRIASMIPRGLHPNYISLLGAVCALAASSLITETGYQMTAALFYVLYLVADNLDGLHARNTNQTSSFGHALDHFVDGFAGFHVMFSIGCLGVMSSNMAWTRHMFRVAFLSAHTHSLYTGGSLALAFPVPGTGLQLHLDDFQTLMVAPLLFPRLIPSPKMSAAWLEAGALLVAVVNLSQMLWYVSRGRGTGSLSRHALAFVNIWWAIGGFVNISTPIYSDAYYFLLIATLAGSHM